jgi:hypothetical protein
MKYAYILQACSNPSVQLHRGKSHREIGSANQSAEARRRSQEASEKRDAFAATSEEGAAVCSFYCLDFFVVEQSERSWLHLLSEEIAPNL